jgi:hypothetical protein
VFLTINETCLLAYGRATCMIIYEWGCRLYLSVVIISGGSVVIISGDNSTIHLNTLALLSELFSKDFFNIHFTNEDPHLKTHRYVTVSMLFIST